MSRCSIFASRCSIFAFLLSSCLLIGCGRFASTPQDAMPRGNVAVVDLDEVANQLGLGQQWASKLSEKQATVNQQLTGFQQKLNEQLEQKRSQTTTANGSDASLLEDQQIQLASYQQELNDKLRRAQTEAKKHLGEERSRIIQNYRQQAKLISAEVAKQNGFDVVLTKNDSVVLSYTPGADITQEVAKQLKRRLEAEDVRP